MTDENFNPTSSEQSISLLETIQQGEMSHDRFVYWLFQHNFYVRLFLKQFLPENILNELNLNTLEPIPSRLIDDKGQENIGDVFYQVRTKSGGYKTFVILLEHKSSISRDASLQMLRYSVALLDYMYKNPQIYADREGKIPTPYPFLFCQESCPHYTDVVSRLHPDDNYGVSFEYQTVDVSKIDLEQLRSVVYLFASFSLLKFAKDPKGKSWEEQKRKVFEIVDLMTSSISTPEEQEQNINFIGAFLSYSSFFMDPKIQSGNFMSELVQHERNILRGNRMAPSIVERFAAALAGKTEFLEICDKLDLANERAAKADKQAAEAKEQAEKAKEQVVEINGELLQSLRARIEDFLLFRFTKVLSSSLCNKLNGIVDKKALEQLAISAKTDSLETIESKIASFSTIA